jgi:hypothetical protein
LHFALSSFWPSETLPSQEQSRGASPHLNRCRRHPRCRLVLQRALFQRLIGAEYVVRLAAKLAEVAS